MFLARNKSLTLRKKTTMQPLGVENIVPSDVSCEVVKL